MIDTGSTISTIQSTSRDTSRNPDSKVLYSATANEIQTYGEKVLHINFGSDCNYTWCFTKTDLRFSVIGIDFLPAHKLIVDSYNRSLIDKNRNCVIPLFPAHSVPLKICCILAQKSEFHRVLSRYSKIFNPPHRYQHKAHGIEHAIRTNGKIVISKLRRTSQKFKKLLIRKLLNG